VAAPAFPTQNQESQHPSSGWFLFFLLVGPAPGFVETRTPEPASSGAVQSNHPLWYTSMPAPVSGETSQRPAASVGGLPKPRPVLALLTLLLPAVGLVFLHSSLPISGPPPTTFRVLASWTRNSSDAFAFLQAFLYRPYHHHTDACDAMPSLSLSLPLSALRICSQVRYSGELVLA
jgi:hypothetical protein